MMAIKITSNRQNPINRNFGRCFANVCTLVPPIDIDTVAWCFFYMYSQLNRNQIDRRMFMYECILTNASRLHILHHNAME